MNKKAKCKGCPKTFEKRLLSKRGVCFECSLINQVEARKQMINKEGPYYEKWKAQHLAGLKAYIKRIEKEGK